MSYKGKQHVDGYAFSGKKVGIDGVVSAEEIQPKRVVQKTRSVSENDNSGNKTLW